MDQAKTTQALKQIFDQCGTDILKDYRRFESVLMDMLPGSDCKTERMLFQSALNSSALPLLLRTTSFTPDAARRAVEQLQKDCFMNEDAAKFIVRCVTAARGGDPKIVDGASPEPPRPTPPKRTPPKPEPEPPKPTPPKPEPKPYIPPEPPKPSEPHELATLYSKMFVPGRFFNTTPQGNLHMYQDRLLFLPNKGKGQVEMPYQDIYKIKDRMMFVFWWTIFLIAVPIVTAFWMSEYEYLIYPVFIITSCCILIECLIVWDCRHRLILQMNYAISRLGNRYRPVYSIWIFSPTDKKQAVSIIKSKMTTHP